jgi:hypothetical protein
MTGGGAEGDETTDASAPAHHPLVATRALLEGRVGALPGPLAERRPSGRLPRFALNAMLHVAEALFSVRNAPPPPERMAWLAAELDDFMARAGGAGRLQFAVASGLVTLLAPLRVGRLPGLGRLALRDRVYALERFEETLAAPLLIALRAILCLLYYEHPDAAREVGIGVAGPAGARLLGERER